MSSPVRVLLVTGSLGALLASACARAGGPPCTGGVELPQLTAGEATTPDEVGIILELKVSDPGATLPRDYWKSLQLDRGPAAPDGTPWANAGEDVFLTEVAFRPEPVIRLGLSRFARKNGQPVLNRPLTFHLKFDESHARTGCPDPDGWTEVELELTLVADTGPLRLDHVSWRRPGR